MLYGIAWAINASAPNDGPLGLPQVRSTGAFATDSPVVFLASAVFDRCPSFSSSVVLHGNLTGNCSAINVATNRNLTVVVSGGDAMTIEPSLVIPIGASLLRNGDGRVLFLSPVNSAGVIRVCGEGPTEFLHIVNCSHIFSVSDRSVVVLWSSLLGRGNFVVETGGTVEMRSWSGVLRVQPDVQVLQGLLRTDIRDALVFEGTVLLESSGFIATRGTGGPVTFSKEVRFMSLESDAMVVHSS